MTFLASRLCGVETTIYSVDCWGEAISEVFLLQMSHQKEKKEAPSQSPNVRLVKMAKFCICLFHHPHPWSQGAHNLSMYNGRIVENALGPRVLKGFWVKYSEVTFLKWKPGFIWPRSTLWIYFSAKYHEITWSGNSTAVDRTGVQHHVSIFPSKKITSKILI